jgi:hypothetical protein
VKLIEIERLKKEHGDRIVDSLAEKRNSLSLAGWFASKRLTARIRPVRIPGMSKPYLKKPARPGKFRTGNSF